MPVCGTRRRSVGGSYEKNPMYGFAQEFANLAQNVMSESTLDLFEEPRKVLRRESTRAAVKDFFVEGSYDTSKDAMTTEELNDHINMMNEQFENNVEAMYEHAALADFNPVIGMGLAVHKHILMNMVYDKGAIAKAVAVEPKFTRNIETRMLITPDGEEIDMFRQQNLMTAAMNATNPVKEIEITLPETETLDIIKDEFGGTNLDSLAIMTHISAILIKGVYIAEGDILPDANGYIKQGNAIATDITAGAKDVWFPVNIPFKPGYSGYERTAAQSIKLAYKSDALGTIVELKDTISGTFDHNKFNIVSAYGKVTKVKLKTKLDTSNAMIDTCSVSWKIDTTLVEMDNAIPLNVTISPQELKDLAASYHVNQITKNMDLIQTVLANYRDDTIKTFLDDSYDRIPVSQKSYGEFDFAPRESYGLDHVEYRQKTFFDWFDQSVTKLLQVLNDPNMTVTLFGDPDLVRRITPTAYSYSAPSNLGPVELDYTRTVTTSDKRVYQFIGSDKLRGSDEFTVILNPRNSDRIIYIIYDYQMYLSNEIRNNKNPALPALHAFDRFKVDEYQPVQGRVKILNRSGLRDDPHYLHVKNTVVTP